MHDSGEGDIGEGECVRGVSAWGRCLRSARCETCVRCTIIQVYVQRV